MGVSCLGEDKALEGQRAAMKKVSKRAARSCRGVKADFNGA